MNISHRKLIALAGVTASLALPVAAYAQTAQTSAPAAASRVGAQQARIDFASIATELNLSVDQVRSAFRDNRPAKTGTRPTPAQRDAALAATAAQLGVSFAQLKSLVAEYAGGAAGTTGTGTGAAAGARQQGPSAAKVAAKLGLPVASVAAAMQTAHASVASITDPAARKAAFQAAVASALGVPTTTVTAAFASLKAAKLVG